MGVLKMKKIFLVLIMFVLLFSGCDKAKKIVDKTKKLVIKEAAVVDNTKISVPVVKTKSASKGKVVVTPVPVKKTAAAVAEKDDEYSIAYINEIKGECELKRKGKEIGESLSEIYTPLYVGDTVITESGSSLEIIFDDATIISLDSNSRMVIQSLDRGLKKKTILQLIKGRIMAVVKKLSNEEEFKIKTKMAMAAVKGTEFIIEADDDDRVGVYEGSVEVSGLDMDGKVMHKIILDKDKETVIVKKLRRPEKATKLSKNFVRKYKDIEDIREKIKYVRELRRSGKVRQYKLKRRLERIDRLKQMRRDPKMKKKWNTKDKQLMNEIIKREAFYKARLDRLEEKEKRKKRIIKHLKKEKIGDRD